MIYKIMINIIELRNFLLSFFEINKVSKYTNNILMNIYYIIIKFNTLQNIYYLR